MRSEMLLRAFKESVFGCSLRAQERRRRRGMLMDQLPREEWHHEQLHNHQQTADVWPSSALIGPQSRVG